MSNGRVIRKNSDSLTASELAALQDGYSRMQAIRDNRGFNHIAGFHGTPGNYCHRDPDLFLPWHRAYVYHFEQYLRDQALTAAVPWWDWTSDTSRQTGIPTAFSSLTTASGTPNPLLKSRINAPTANPPVDRDTVRSTGDPNRLPVPSDVANLLSIQDFLDFSGQFDFGLHGRIHIWVAGDMASVPFAAYDPIFYSHHCMVDRIWYLWQQRHGVNNIPRALLNRPLPPFNLTVADVLDISELGYEYAVDQVVINLGV